MEIDDIEEKKKKVLNEFMYTRKHIRSIAKENNLSLKEVYAILEEYNRDEKIQRPGNISFQSMPKDETEEEIGKLYDKIYQLRKAKMSYKAISDETGIDYDKVIQICKQAFEAFEEKEPEQGYSTIIFSEEAKSLYDKIYQLRKAKMSYEAISEKTGFSVYLIKKICKKIFDEKGEKITEASKKKWKIEEAKSLYDKIYQLRKAKMSYKAISENTGFSVYIIKGICKIFDEKDLAKMILNLITTKKATLEQVQIIADYYGVDLEETMNSLDER